MQEDPKFRLAIEGDADLLLDFMRAYYAFDGHGFDRENARAALVTLLRNPDFGRAWLILDGSDPVGYVVICFGYSLECLGRDAFVDEFYLREAYRNRGWGKKTMRFVEQSAQELGVRALHLEVMDGNLVAMHIYKKLGFKPHSSTFLSKWIEDGFSKPAPQNRQQAAD